MLLPKLRLLKKQRPLLKKLQNSLQMLKKTIKMKKSRNLFLRRNPRTLLLYQAKQKESLHL
jgi:hypothetical protein